MPCSHKLIIILVNNNNRAAANHHHVWPIGIFIPASLNLVKLYYKSNYFKIVFVSILICQLRSYFSNVSKRMNAASGKQKRTVSVERHLTIGHVFTTIPTNGCKSEMEVLKNISSQYAGEKNASTC